MKERGITMTGESAPAILDDSKSQTRRLVKGAPDDTIEVVPSLHHHFGDLWDFRRRLHNPVAIRCPYGTAGSRLWIREAWRTYERPEDAVDGILFRDGAAFVPIENTQEAADRWVEAHDNGSYGDRWRSPRFMPRWVSRCELEITEVRVQRLQEISEDDARAGGAAYRIAPGGDLHGAFEGLGGEICYRAHYRDRWDRINAARAPWASNPWVFAISFRRVAP